MKKLFFILGFLLISTTSFSQLRLVENFEYPSGSPGDSIGAHGWVWFSGVANTIMVTSPGLIFPGYPLSGIGNATTLNTNGNDNYKSLSETDSTNSYYCSFMVRVDSAKAQGDYILAFLPNNSTTFFEARVQARIRAGVVNFGITKANTTSDTTVAGIWTTGNYSLNTVYVLVVKYTFVPGGTTNDQVSLFVFDNSYPGTEPAPTLGPNVYPSVDAANIGRVALRQGTATRAPYAVVDGIIVSRSWPSKILSVKLGIQGITSFITEGANVFENLNDTTGIFLRSTISPYNVVDTAFSVIDSTTLRGTYYFPNSTLGTNYYYDVVYRRIVNARNGVATYSTVQQFNNNPYDFTTSPTKAYGDNQVPVGPIFTIYNGDCNQDGAVDLDDMAEIDNDIFDFAEGYLNTDLDGNFIVDIGDATIADNNSFNFVGEILPP